MSSDHQPSPFTSIHAPLAILGLAIACFLWTNIDNARHGADVMEWQAQNLQTQLDNLKKGEEQLVDALKQRDTLVEQAKTVEAQYTSLLTDLIELAKDDEDTMKVVQKWNIQRQEPTGDSPAAAPSAGASASASPTPAPAAP